MLLSLMVPSKLIHFPLLFGVLPLHLIPPANFGHGTVAGGSGHCNRVGLVGRNGSHLHTAAFASSDCQMLSLLTTCWGQRWLLLMRRRRRRRRLMVPLLCAVASMPPCRPSG